MMFFCVQHNTTYGVLAWYEKIYANLKLTKSIDDGSDGYRNFR